MFRNCSTSPSTSYGAFPEPSFVAVCTFKTYFIACPLALKNIISPFLFTFPVSYHVAIFNSCLVSSLPSLPFQSILFTPHTTIIVQSHSFVHLLLNCSSTHWICKVFYTIINALFYMYSPTYLSAKCFVCLLTVHWWNWKSHSNVVFTSPFNSVHKYECYGSTLLPTSRPNLRHYTETCYRRKHSQ